MHFTCLCVILYYFLCEGFIYLSYYSFIIFIIHYLLFSGDRIQQQRPRGAGGPHDKDFPPHDQMHF